MNQKGFGIQDIGYALGGAVLLLVFMMAYQPLLDAMLPSIVNVSNYTVIALLLGLVSLLLVVLFISSIMNPQRPMYPPYQ